MKKTIHSQSHEETLGIAMELGKKVTASVAIALHGDVGTGKTTFAQGFARGFDVPAGYYVTSPTYNIINEYPGRLRLHHMDLYRLGSPDELEHLGMDDIIASGSVIMVEWPRILMEYNGILSFDLHVRLETDGLCSREITFITSGLEGENLLKSLFC
ncbi:MAG: tRNA (adenosine(37)-N6)-threonylcarbamoyltransferase complex ATPase subunit type 1 TsaE [Desulfamplus sp.]|nr:tRNA (adenosine(37)-N6)-threonylcarbamoyltransferase complex ATPase subunit type 1 TsaE [Desulfamplus sp.]